MERHDPLSQLTPATPVPEPTKRARVRNKVPPLLKAVATVSDETLAFLYGGAEQAPGDYKRHLKCVDQIRQEFVTFCQANLHYSDWRSAWAAFMAGKPVQSKSLSIHTITPDVAHSVNPIVPPNPLKRWRQRMRTLSALHAT